MLWFKRASMVLPRSRPAWPTQWPSTMEWLHQWMREGLQEPFFCTSVEPLYGAPQQPSLKLERDAFDGWIRSWLDGHVQSVMVHVCMEIWRVVSEVRTGTCSVYYIPWCNTLWRILSKFSDSTKLSSAIDTPQGWNVIQRDLEKPGQWGPWEINEVQQGQVQSDAPGSEQEPCSQYNR